MVNTHTTTTWAEICNKTQLFQTSKVTTSSHPPVNRQKSSLCNRQQSTCFKTLVDGVETRPMEATVFFYSFLPACLVFLDPWTFMISVFSQLKQQETSSVKDKKKRNNIHMKYPRLLPTTANRSPVSVNITRQGTTDISQRASPELMGPHR